MKQIIIKMLSEKAGRDVTTPAGAQWLSYDISTVTGQSLSPQTVKRFTGVIGQGETRQSRTTSDILARYLGFADFPALEDYITHYGSSAFREPRRLIDVVSLPVGARLTLRWSPDREVTLRKLESGQCLIEAAANAKLQVGDLVQVHQVMASYPLICTSVERNGEQLGQYTAGGKSGLSYAKVHNPE